MPAPTPRLPQLYAPEAFAENDPAKLFAFMAEHPFATLVTAGAGPGEGGAAISHVPLIADEAGRRLTGHLARENEQVAQVLAAGGGAGGGCVATAVFHGPHGYVSPTVYEGQRGVPTWNYVVVHARGRLRLVGEAALVRILDESAARFDTAGYRPRFGEGGAEGWPEVPRQMLDAIVGFELEIEELQGKWKLSQNRSEQDRGRVIAWLDQGDDSARQVAALMRQRRQPPG